MRSRRPWCFLHPMTPATSRERNCLWMAASHKCRTLIAEGTASRIGQTEGVRRMEHELMKRRVVVTGLGLITPLGNTVEATWAGLMTGRSGAGPITKFDTSDFPVRFACEVKDFDPFRYIEK